MATPTEFLVAAKKICAIADDESTYRASINRLYYATFHQCYLYHVRLPQPGSVGQSNGRHNQLISQLNYPAPGITMQDKVRSIAVGKMLRYICAKRVIADYDLKSCVTDVDMADALRTADSIFGNT